MRRMLVTRRCPSHRAMLAVALAILAALPARRVEAQRVAEVQVAPPFLRLRPDAVVAMLATAYDDQGNPLIARFRWTSSNINVAVVDSAGNVRGVAPGVAIVTAYVEGARRRGGQVTVIVSSGMPPGVHVMPPMPPSAPGMPPLPAPPSPPEMVHVMPPRFPSDSAMFGTVDCNDRMMSVGNPRHACWDTRPRARENPVVPMPATCTLPRATMVALVHVSETGEAVEVAPLGGSGCQQFTEAVLARVRQTRFEPATKNGRPTHAWIFLVVRSERAPEEPPR